MEKFKKSFLSITVFPARSSSGTQHDGSSCPCRGRSRLLSVIVIVAIGLFGMVTAIVVVLHFTGILVTIH